MSGSTLSSFTPGDIIISVVGSTPADGGGSYGDNQAAPITLEEINPTTGAIVGSFVLPQQTVTVNGVTEYATSGEYGSSSEGILQLSANGKSLTIAGYGVNAETFNAGGAATYGSAALAQSTSLTTQTQYTPVARVVADISYDKTTGTIVADTSTDLYNVYNVNNPRSVATVNGTSFYFGGQGNKDVTQGVYTAKDGANAATAIDTGYDARDVEIINGTLYTSYDSKVGTGRTGIGTYGSTLPTSATTWTELPGIGGSVTLSAGQGNALNGSTGTVNLSPEQYFFANSSTLYIADGGTPKAGGVGDGGLQKWSLVSGTWDLDYTLTSGLDLVSSGAASGTSGLIGLTGVVNSGGTVTFYATNETIGDLDQTYLYTITDSLAATTLPTTETFSALVSAGADSNIRGVAFAPVDALPTGSNYVVVTGSPQSNGTVNSGGSLTVSSGGVATGFTLLSGAIETVATGGAESGTTLAQGATETLYGTATGDFVEGIQIITSGGTAAGVIGNETVYNGGVASLSIAGTSASGTTVENGGQLELNGNVVGSNTTILAGGIVALQSKKAELTGSLTFSGSGGQLQVGANSSAGYGALATISGFAAGDSVLFTSLGSSPTAVGSYNSTTSTTTETVSGGGAAVTLVFAGNVASSLTVMTVGSEAELVVGAAVASSGTSGNVLIVSATQSSAGLVISAGETLSVQSGGIVTNTTVQSGGSAVVVGTDSGTILQSGGSATIYGMESGATISAGGFETLSGSATGDVIAGTQQILGGTSIVSNETVLNGGMLELFIAGSIASNTVVSSGGQLLISGRGSAVNTVLDGGSLLEFQSPKATVSGTLTFSGAAVYELTVPTNTTTAGLGDQAVIEGFVSGAAIALPIIASAGATLTSAVSGGNTDVTVSGGGTTETFIFAGLYSSGFFALAPFSGTGAEIAATASVPCYCHGTLIETADGEVPVERLQAGDLVRTVSGALQPIRWVGRRSYAGRFLAGRRNLLPILIRAGALGGGLPRRDLRISPCHAMLLEGLLVPGAELVNGTTIVPDHSCTRVDYVHVELDQHDAILAEGAASETFIDHDSAGLFHNAAGRPPGGATADCAPRMVAGYALEAIRRRLAA